VLLERLPGFEPGSSPWQGDALPIEPQPRACQAPLLTLERSTGIEPVSPVWKTGVSAQFTRTASPVRGLNPVFWSESPVVYPPQPHGRLRYVDLSGFEPLTPGLPNRCATNCATSPKSGTPESNGVSRAPKAHGLPSPSFRMRPDHPGSYRPLWSFQRSMPPTSVGATHGQQESNPHPPVLETGALPVELHP